MTTPSRPEYQPPPWQQPAPDVALPEPAGGGPQPPTVPACAFCGGCPAVTVAFRAHRGELLWFRIRKVDGPFCRSCGIAFFRHTQAQTLWQGWWSVLSFMLLAWLTLILNLLARRKVTRLSHASGGVHGFALPSGKPLHRRPLSYVAVVPALWAINLFAGLPMHF